MKHKKSSYGECKNAKTKISKQRVSKSITSIIIAQAPQNNDNEQANQVRADFLL